MFDALCIEKLYRLFTPKTLKIESKFAVSEICFYLLNWPTFPTQRWCMMAVMRNSSFVIFLGQLPYDYPVIAWHFVRILLRPFFFDLDSL